MSQCVSLCKFVGQPVFARWRQNRSFYPVPHPLVSFSLPAQVGVIHCVYEAKIVKIHKDADNNTFLNVLFFDNDR